MADMVANDETDLTLTLVGRDRNRINLVGGSVDLSWRINGGALVTVGMTLITPAEGIVRYRFQQGDLEPGRFTADVAVTTADGQTFRNRIVLSLEVRKHV